MKPLVYYHFLDLPPELEASLTASFEEVERLLKLPPVQVKFGIGRLPEHVRPQIEEDIKPSEFWQCSMQVQNTLCKMIGRLGPKSTDGSVFPRLIVCCRREHPLAQKCLASQPAALWGAALGCLAVVYELSDPCAVWHELLHLLDADDCYGIKNGQVVHRGPTCEHPQCIMQYAPCQPVVDGHLPLCERNAELIGKALTGIKE